MGLIRTACIERTHFGTLTPIKYVDLQGPEPRELFLEHHDRREAEGRLTEGPWLVVTWNGSREFFERETAVAYMERYVQVRMTGDHAGEWAFVRDPAF